MWILILPPPLSSLAATEITLELNLYLTPTYDFLHAVEGEDLKSQCYRLKRKVLDIKLQ